MPVHSFKCIALAVLLYGNSSKIKMAAGRHVYSDNDHNVPSINRNHTLNKMTPAWHKSVKRFRSYRIYCVFACCHFVDRKMREARLKCSQNSREFSREQNYAGLESISQMVQKLYFQMLVFRNSRWRPAAKMAEFFHIAGLIDLHCQEIYLCHRGCL
jgi:hypothetical protein